MYKVLPIPTTTTHPWRPLFSSSSSPLSPSPPQTATKQNPFTDHNSSPSPPHQSPPPFLPPPTFKSQNPSHSQIPNPAHISPFSTTLVSPTPNPLFLPITAPPPVAHLTNSRESCSSGTRLARGGNLIEFSGSG